MRWIFKTTCSSTKTCCRALARRGEGEKHLKRRITRLWTAAPSFWIPRSWRKRDWRRAERSLTWTSWRNTPLPRRCSRAKSRQHSEIASSQRRPKLFIERGLAKKRLPGDCGAKAINPQDSNGDYSRQAGAGIPTREMRGYRKHDQDVLHHKSHHQSQQTKSPEHDDNRSPNNG